MIRVKHLRKVYPGGRIGVDDISFGVDKGEIVGLLGPNGAGKTTTIKCLCGLVMPTSGEIFVGDVNVVKHPRGVASLVSAVLEGNRNVYWRLTVKENAMFFASLNGVPKKRALEIFDRWVGVFGLEDKVNVQGRFLSRGYQQKLALLCCLMRDTPILLLDEPTLGLDVESTVEMRRLVKDLAEQDRKTVLLSTHDMATVEAVCERVLIIKSGKLVADDDVEVLKDMVRMSCYRIHFSGKISDRDFERLGQITECLKQVDDGAIEFELPDPEGLYNVLDVLRHSGCIVEFVGKEDLDFAEVYLRVVGS